MKNQVPNMYDHIAKAAGVDRNIVKRVLMCACYQPEFNQMILEAIEKSKKEK